MSRRTVQAPANSRQPIDAAERSTRTQRADGAAPTNAAPAGAAEDALQRQADDSPQVRALGELRALTDRADRWPGMMTPDTTLHRASHSASPGAFRGNAAAPVQRIIRVGDASYGAGDDVRFAATYNQAHQQAMLTAINDAPQAPTTVAAALGDPRTFTMTLVEDDPEFGPLYGAQATALVRAVQGGRTREAAAVPEYVQRPGAGFEEITIGGLIMCIGVIIEAGAGGLTTAAVGAHFVTPTSVTDGALSAEGTGQLAAMLRAVAGQGTLTATLCHAASAEGVNPHGRGASVDAMVALNQIVNYLTSHGVSAIVIRETNASIAYTLRSDGTHAVRG